MSVDFETFFREWPLTILRRVARGGFFGEVFGAITSVNDPITFALEWWCSESGVIADDLKPVQASRLVWRSSINKARHAPRRVRPLKDRAARGRVEGARRFAKKTLLKVALFTCLVWSIRRPAFQPQLKRMKDKGSCLKA